MCVTLLGPLEVHGMVSTGNTGVNYAATRWVPFAQFADVVAVLTLLDVNGEGTQDFTVKLAVQFAATDTSSPGAWDNALDTTNVLTESVDEACAAGSPTVTGNHFWIRFGFFVVNDTGTQNLRISARLTLSGTA